MKVLKIIKEDRLILSLFILGWLFIAIGVILWLSSPVSIKIEPTEKAFALATI